LIFTAIITTLERPLEVLRLVNQIQNCGSSYVFEVLVINSGKPIKELENKSGLRQIFSPRKNQPYQRFLGAESAKTEWITFFDDDLIILDTSLFEVLFEGISFPNAVGAGVGLLNEGEKFNYNLKNISRGNKAGFFCGLNEKNSRIGGSFPVNLEKGWNLNIECLSGGNAITLRRKSYLKTIGISKIINLAEIGKAKGEDKYITRAITLYGELNYYNEPLIQHPKPNQIQTNYKFNYKSWRYEIARARFLLADLDAKIKRKNRLVFAFKMFICYCVDLFRAISSQKALGIKIKLMVLFLPSVLYAIRWTYIVKNEE
jgi:glycosyltransferase involved in cell wall biosynthesis